MGSASNETDDEKRIANDVKADNSTNAGENDDDPGMPSREGRSTDGSGLRHLRCPGGSGGSRGGAGPRNHPPHPPPPNPTPPPNPPREAGAGGQGGGVKGGGVLFFWGWTRGGGGAGAPGAGVPHDG